MTKHEIPFDYSISFKEDELSMFEEEFVYFVIDRYTKVDDEYLKPIKFPSDKNGVRGTEMSGNFRDCLTKYFFNCTYSDLFYEAPNNPKILSYLNFIDSVIRKILFEIHYNLDYLSNGVRYLHFSKKDPVIDKRNKSQLETLDKFIKILDPNSFKKYQLNTKIEVYGSEIDLEYNQESLKRSVFENYIINTIDMYLKNMNSEGELTYVEIAYKIATESTNPFITSLDTLKSLCSFSKKLDLTSTENGNWGRLYIGLLENIDSLLNETYNHLHTKLSIKVGGNKIEKNLAILHAFSLYDLIPNNFAVYKKLYDEKYTRLEISGTVKEFMKLKNGKNKTSTKKINKRRGGE